MQVEDFLAGYVREHFGSKWFKSPQLYAAVNHSDWEWGNVHFRSVIRNTLQKSDLFEATKTSPRRALYRLVSTGRKKVEPPIKRKPKVLVIPTDNVTVTRLTRAALANLRRRYL